MASRRRSVVWAQSARSALDEVIAYIAQDSQDRAVQVLMRALDTAAGLETLADRGRVVPELSDPAIRELFVYRYRSCTKCSMTASSFWHFCTELGTS